MEADNVSNVPEQGGVSDRATLFLCRQGERWVVVIESPCFQGAVRLDHTGRDPYDARFELLCSARRACPDAAIVSTDGALESADYEWRLEIRGVETNTGDLGMAVQREISAEPARHADRPSRRQSIRTCHWGRCPEVSGRPRSF